MSLSNPPKITVIAGDWRAPHDSLAWAYAVANDIKAHLDGREPRTLYSLPELVELFKKHKSYRHYRNGSHKPCASFMDWAFSAVSVGGLGREHAERLFRILDDLKSAPPEEDPPEDLTD